MYHPKPPRRPWRGSAACDWYPDRMTSPTGRYGPRSYLAAYARKNWGGTTAILPCAPLWRLRSPHYGIELTWGYPKPADWRETVVARKRRSNTGNQPIIRRARVKQRRLDRHLCDPDSGEWEE